MGRAEQEAHTEVLGMTYTAIAVCLAIPAIIVLFSTGELICAWALVFAEIAHIVKAVAQYFVIPPDMRRRDPFAM